MGNLGRAVEEGRSNEVMELRSRNQSWARTVLLIVAGMQKLIAGHEVDQANQQPPLVRGIEGRLPLDFFVPDERGMVTLTEYGFMSTSRAPGVAGGFAGGGVTVLMYLETSEKDVF